MVELAILVASFQIGKPLYLISALDVYPLVPAQRSVVSSLFRTFFRSGGSVQDDVQYFSYILTRQPSEGLRLNVHVSTEAITERTAMNSVADVRDDGVQLIEIVCPLRNSGGLCRHNRFSNSGAWTTDRDQLRLCPRRNNSRLQGERRCRNAGPGSASRSCPAGSLVTARPGHHPGPQNTCTVVTLDP
jgi:hypothetical protein